MRKLIWMVSFLIVLPFSANAGEEWKTPGRPHVCDNIDPVRLAKCQAWLGALKTPSRSQSCCGDADAWVSDIFDTLPNGDIIATITAKYPSTAYEDEEGNQLQVPSRIDMGMMFLVPRAKQNHAPEDAGNTSGHGIIFIRISDLEVLCYEPPPLT